jgi:flagellar L-ring protein precursor FlgH
MTQSIKTAIVIAALLFFWGGLQCEADSLWQQETDNGKAKSMYSDSRGYREGDTVIVLITESAQAVQSASTKTQKNGAVSGGLGANIPIAGNLLGLSASESQNGLGSNLRTGRLTAKLSVTITKVLPNGNLEIKGTHIVTVNEEKENIEVTGVIRSTDISAENTVLSTAIADARIKYEGKGPLGEKTRPGILTRLLDWLWIF